MHFNLMLNSWKQFKYEKSLKSEYISDSILFNSGEVQMN